MFSDQSRGVYISNECISICTSILDDERAGTPASADAAGWHLLGHPLAFELMTRVEDWVRAESLGEDGLDELRQVHETARRMVTGE